MTEQLTLPWRESRPKALLTNFVPLDDIYAWTLGQDYALTYKNYGISSRAARQRLMQAGRNLSMLAMPEAGM